MGDKKRPEEQIRKVGGRYAEEIIGLVRTLAEVDVRIKDELDEIERVSESLVRRHNELADRINSLIAKSVDRNDHNEIEEALDDLGVAGQKADMKINVAIRVTTLPG